MVRQGFFWLLLVIAGLLAYAALIEPNWLECTQHSLAGNLDHTLKVAHLTDLHLRKVGILERRVIAAVRSEAPDLILVTGDTLDSVASLQVAKEFFGGLSAPLGIYAVLGNWENWEHFSSVQLFRSFGVNLLINERVNLGNGVSVVGFDDWLSGQPARVLATEGSGFCISMIHSPEFFGKDATHCPLVLAGHTHGGQIRIPLLGPLWLPPGSGKYVSGWYRSADSALYVSRGTGTSVLPIRFLARPEIAFFTIGPKQ